MAVECLWMRFRRLWEGVLEIVLALLVLRDKLDWMESLKLLAALAVALTNTPWLISLKVAGLLAHSVLLRRFYRRKSADAISIPHAWCLPLLGETIQFKAASEPFLRSRFSKYGDIFQTHVDFSSYHLLARRVVCLNYSLERDSIEQDQLRLMSYMGFYGATCWFAHEVPALSTAIVSQIDHVPGWESKATKSVLDFFQRLEQQDIAFDFDDKIREFACEIIGSVFLNIQSYDPILCEAFCNYHSLSQSSREYNANIQYYRLITQYIAIAIEGLDVLHCSSHHRNDTDKAFLQDILEAIHTTMGVDSGDQCDVVCVLLVEYLYPLLVMHLHSVLCTLLVPARSALLSTLLLQYECYLSARHMIAGGGERGGRFSWAGVVGQSMYDDINSNNNSVDSNNSSSSDSARISSQGDKAEEKSCSKTERSADISSVTSLLSPTDESLDHYSLLLSPSFPVITQQSKRSGRSIRKRHRDRAAEQAKMYINSIQEITSKARIEAQNHCIADNIYTGSNNEMPYSLSLCEQGFGIEDQGRVYAIQRNDIVLQVLDPHYLHYPIINNTPISNDNISRNNTNTSDSSLGYFGKLVLDIFVHELVSGYRWSVLAESGQAETEAEAGQGGLWVGGFHSVNSLPLFLDNEEENQEEGKDENEDERYFSDGL